MAQIKEEDVIPILKELIKAKTENPPGETTNAVMYLTKLFDSVGITYELQEYKKGHINIIAEYGEGEKSIILTGHLDTVPAGDEHFWNYPPFDAVESQGQIYGRGSTDMKSAVAAFVAILLWLKKHNIKLNRKIIFFGSADEEVGMDGAAYAKENGVMKNCEFLLIGEPTDLNVAIAEKGTLWVEVNIEGKAAHGSTPELGINAVEEAAKLIPKMKSVIPRKEHSILGKSTLNIGKITGGTAINVVPENCSFQCDYRLTSNVKSEKVWGDIVKLIEDFNNQSSAKVSVRKIHEIPPIEVQREHKLLDAFKNYARKLKKQVSMGVNYGTDGAMLIPKTNVPFVICGPGHLDQLHVVDEHVDKQQVIDYANMVLDILLDYCKVNY